MRGGHRFLHASADNDAVGARFLIKALPRVSVWAAPVPRSAAECVHSRIRNAVGVGLDKTRNEKIKILAITHGQSW